MLSVIFPVYNSAAFLSASLDSLLRQSYGAFELIAIDDGSSDGSLDILERVGDSRLRIVRNSTNQGISNVLNQGLEAAQHRYVARMDSDDIALPERFAAQIALLQSRPTVAVCGTNAVNIDSEGTVTGRRRYAAGSREIRFQSIFTPPFLHPSVMIDRQRLPAAELHYAVDQAYVEDFDLWYRLLRHADGANIPAPLLRYRIHGGSITSAKRERQLELHHQRIRAHLADIGIAATQAEASGLRWLLAGGDRPAVALGATLDVLLAAIHATKASPAARAWAAKRALAALVRARDPGGAALVGAKMLQALRP